MKTLLLTGATGFVGSNMLVQEAQRGTRILAPVRSAEKLRRQLAEEGISSENVITLDTDPATWGEIRPTHALLSAGVLFARSREEYHRVNVDWTLRVLDALPPDCRIVVLSSQAAGGPTPAGTPARTERHADSPITLYGKSKLELEQAIHRTHSDRPITILRPPMVLGARDTATLPLFKMASGLVRPKPGLGKKEYSFIAVEDLLEAVNASWESGTRGPFYIASESTITDFELIRTAALATNGRGVTIPLPQVIIKCFSLVVDAVPSLRASAPSLTRDRARDIWEDRWVVDSTCFRQTTCWKSTRSLQYSLQSAHDFYVRAGHLKRSIAKKT
jgi:nucleoside-diphosphate-sugar epimerase